MRWRSARRGAGRRRFEPGTYETVLEPTAVGMLMSRIMGAFDARSADEGRSYFSKRGGGTLLGEKVFDERVTIASDPGFANGETAPFTGLGEPTGPDTWVETACSGIFSTRATGRSGRRSRPSRDGELRDAGHRRVARRPDCVGEARRAHLTILVHPALNPRTLTLTGLTRDGTFLIENGKISRPITNFRFNQSMGNC
jgi:hypothetical protein